MKDMEWGRPYNNTIIIITVFKSQVILIIITQMQVCDVTLLTLMSIHNNNIDTA